jgi:anti-sigma B factor antagonist
VHQGDADIFGVEPKGAREFELPLLFVDNCAIMSRILHARRGPNRSSSSEGIDMELTKRKVGDVTIFDLDGKLTIGKGDVILRDALVEEMNGGTKCVLVNLDKVKTIDSSGLGELIRCKVTATSSQAEVKLLHVNIKARKLLTMAQLVGVFEMFDDENLAVESFSA